MFEPFTQLASLDKLTPGNRSTFYKISTPTLKPAFKRPALQTIATLSRRSSHLVPVPYYKPKNVKNVGETIERGERRTKLPNPAVSSHQLLLNATTNSTKQCNSSYLSNFYRPIPHRRHFQAPYAGPPSYATLAQRFSTNPTPVLYYQAIKDSEAIKRKEYVDIHDVGGLNPKDYDVLLIDVDYNVLQGEISTLCGIPYLQEATKSDAGKKVEEATAIVFGPMHRVIFPAVVHNADKDKAHWVYFIIDTGSPLTYLSSQASKLLDTFDDPTGVSIAGFSHYVHRSPPSSHFSDINILGSDFIMAKNIILEPDSARKIVTLYFGAASKWRKPTKL